MLKRILFSLTLPILLLFLHAPPSHAGGVKVVKFGTVAPSGTPWSEQLEDIKARIEKGSGGKIKYKLYLSGSIGGEVEMVRDLRRGRIQAFGGSTAAIAEGAQIPELQAVELPFLFQSFEEADYVMDNYLFDHFRKILWEKGFLLAQWHENGFRNFATTGHEIHTIEDLQKLKMRCQESPAHISMYKTLGVQIETIAVPEVLGALQTGMVDGFDNTPLFSAATGWYEGVKFYTISRHIYQPAAIIYNRQFWESLTEEEQALILGDVKGETTRGRKSVRAMEEEIYQNFRDEGIKVYFMTDPERAIFMEKTKPVHKEFEKISGKETLDLIYKGIGEYRKKKGKGKGD